MAREQAGPGPVLVVPVANVTQHQDTAISGDDMHVAIHRYGGESDRA